MLLLLSLACVPPKETADDTAQFTDTDTTVAYSTYMDPVAVGFEFVGGWDEHRQELRPWLFNSLDYEPYVRIIIVEQEYFQTSPDDPRYYTLYCEVLATLDGGPEPLEARQHDDDAAVTLWGSFAGTLSVFGYGGGDCENFDPDVWPGGQPRWTLDGVPFGVGFGPHTDFLQRAWSDQVIETYGDYMLGVWFAFDRENDDGEVEFIARDWTTGLLWQQDAKTGELIVDGDDRPIGQNINDPVRSGWVSSYAYWFDSLERFVDIRPEASTPTGE